MAVSRTRAAPSAPMGPEVRVQRPQKRAGLVTQTQPVPSTAKSKPLSVFSGFAFALWRLTRWRLPRKDGSQALDVSRSSATSSGDDYFVTTGA